MTGHYIILLLASFSHQLVGFFWSLKESSSLQVSRTLLSILANLNNAVLWMVSILPPIFDSSNPLFNALETVPSAPTTIGITVTWMFHRFFLVLWQSPIFVYLFTFFSFYFAVCWNGKIHNTASSLFFILLFISRPDLVDPFVSQNPR